MIEKYVKKRKFLRKWGWGVLLFSLINALPFQVPIPGILAYYVSLILFVSAVIALVMSYRLPSVKIIGLISEKTNGYITATILIHYLDISTLRAENIISRLFLQGYLKIANKITDDTPIAQWLCSFVGVYLADSSGSSTVENNEPKEAPLTSDMNLSDYTKDNPDISVSDINQMIFANSMNVGNSGQPV